MAPVPDGFDLADPNVQQDPHPHYEALRAERVVHSPANDAYLVMRHEDAIAVLRDPATFSSRLGSGRQPPPEEVRAEIEQINAAGLPRPRTLLDNDPPDHTRFRRLVSRSFTPRRVEALRPITAALADELIDAWTNPHDVDLVADFATLLPAGVIAHALNIPGDRLDDFRRWSDANTAAIGNTLTPDEHVECARAIVEMQQFFVDQFEKRRTAPEDDLFTQLLEAHVGAEDDGTDADPFEMAELVRIVQQLLVAGNETTAKLIADMMRLIADHDGEWERLKADRARVPLVVEESLRLASPNQGMPRIATRDTTIAGVDIPANSKVIVMFASANRDEDLFGCPHEMDPERAHLREQIAFGFGTHYCVGASLARMEAAVALDRLLGRVDHYRLHDDNDFAYLPSYVLRGLRRLHLDATMAPVSPGRPE